MLRAKAMVSKQRLRPRPNFGLTDSASYLLSVIVFHPSGGKSLGAYGMT